MRSINLLVEYKCTQCGAPALLLETDRLFTCAYCKVASYLLPLDYFRLMLPSRAPKDRKTWFFPYWRMKGMHFSCTADGIDSRFVDISHQAVVSRHFPVSLGLRGQTQKLQLISGDTEGSFIRADFDLQTILGIVDQRLKVHRTRKVFHQAHIGETLNLIYSPFYIDKKICDGVVNQPVSSDVPADFCESLFECRSPDPSIELIAALCPSCGWDLQGERDALILACSNCGSLWEPTRKGCKRIQFAHMPVNGSEKEDDMVYLPFWRIKADISGVRLQSYADLVRTANLPRIMQHAWKDIEFCFWSLAFKVPPRNFITLARNLTLSQPSGEWIREFPAGPLYPVKLPVAEAVQSLKIVLASFMKPPEKHFHMLGDISIRPKSYLLVYLPFKVGHNELIQPNFQMAINRNVLGLSGNL